MDRIGIILVSIFFLVSCANDSTDQSQDNKVTPTGIKAASLIGKWQIRDNNPILEGNFITEYFADNSFQQNGTITSFQPNYTCQASSNGTFSIKDSTLSYSYLAEKMFDCQPEEYQLLVDSYMGNKVLETNQNRIILLDETTMVQENVSTKKRFTFTRVKN